MKLKNTQTKTKETPPKFYGVFRLDGGLDFGSYTKMNLKKFIKENPNMRFELKPLLPESSKQRGWFEAGLVPLITFYQENMDHREGKDLKRVREWLKIEFNGDLIAIGGKTHRIAKSTQNKLNSGFLERVVDWLVENYTPPVEVLDPEKFKHWRDTVFPYGGPDNYIDYLLEINILKK
jgi:hypothetical protein